MIQGGPTPPSEAALGWSLSLERQPHPSQGPASWRGGCAPPPRPVPWRPYPGTGLWGVAGCPTVGEACALQSGVTHGPRFSLPPPPPTPTESPGQTWKLSFCGSNQAPRPPTGSAPDSSVAGHSACPRASVSPVARGTRSLTRPRGRAPSRPSPAPPRPRGPSRAGSPPELVKNPRGVREQPVPNL